MTFYEEAGKNKKAESTVHQEWLRATFSKSLRYAVLGERG